MSKVANLQLLREESNDRQEARVGVGPVGAGGCGDRIEKATKVYNVDCVDVSQGRLLNFEVEAGDD